jgi:hypothetical protein
MALQECRGSSEENARAANQIMRLGFLAAGRGGVLICKSIQTPAPQGTV